MFDIGWTELLVLAVIAILIVGPKDLPRMLYSIGQAAGKMRRQADEFRRQFNESMREAGMDEVRNDMKKMSDLNPANQIRNEIESTFTDSPKPGSGQKPAGSEASPAPPGEGDLLEQSQGASERKEGTPDAPQPPKPAPEPAASEPQTAQDEPRSEPKPVGNRNANGAAEAKDAVS
jgi:sec-independent protein translocase protein TatB